MRKPASVTIVVLSVLVVVVVGLLVRASSRAAILEARAADLTERVNTLERERTQLQGRVEAARQEQARRQPTRITKEFVVEAGKVQSYSFTVNMAGTVSGTWRSSGQGYGGADDTISAYRLTDPQDTVVASSASTVRPSTGRFLVKVPEKGTYTLFFENSGLLRTTPRRVFLDAEFRPD